MGCMIVKQPRASKQGEPSIFSEDSNALYSENNNIEPHEGSLENSHEMVGKQEESQPRNAPSDNIHISSPPAIPDASPVESIHEPPGFEIGVRSFSDYVTVSEDSENKSTEQNEDASIGGETLQDSAQGRVKILLSYDFDKTISSTHICKRTKGSSLDPSIREKLLENFNSDECWMGSPERISLLQEHFKIMHSLGCVLCVNSFGYQSVNTWVLNYFGMAEYFEEVSQSIEHGLRPKSKAVFIQRLQETHGIAKDRTMHIDDDNGVCEFIRTHDVAHTLHVRSGIGLMKIHMNQIEVEVRNWIEFGASSLPKTNSSKAAE